MTDNKVEVFLEMLGNLYGTDIAYQESTSTIRIVLTAMEQAYNLGVNDTLNEDSLPGHVVKFRLEELEGRYEYLLKELDKLKQ